MNDKKQVEKQAIEEMANDIAEAINHNSAVDIIRRGLICVNSEGVTRELYDDGYRKQEWISVDEALPENEGEYLVFTKKKNIKVMPFFTERNASASVYGRGFCEWVKGRRTNDYDWWKPVGYITHWMPVPEPPKGGAE